MIIIPAELSSCQYPVPPQHLPVEVRGLPVYSAGGAGSPVSDSRIGSEATGLVKCPYLINDQHNCVSSLSECQVEIRNGVSLFTGSDIRQTSKKGITGKSRGIIKDLSRKSKNRLRILIFSLSKKPLHFLTLTYPKEWPELAATWKKHLDRLSIAIQRDFPGSWFIWKLEPQKRGAPHYHLLGTIRYQEQGMNHAEFRVWLSMTWYNIVGSEDQKHLLAGTQVKTIKDSQKQLCYYVSKYLGKEIDLSGSAWENPGRFWGKSGSIPPIRRLTVDLSLDQFCLVRRLVRRWLRSLNHRSTLRYSKRLAIMSNFHVILPWILSARIIQYALNVLPGGAVGPSLSI